jgi:peptidoglycan/xylan/chitin deacetylase (PgdA/CDA1 family)
MTRSEGIPVLLYHSVTERPRSWGAVSPAQFQAHLALIAASGRRAMTMSALASAIRDARPLVDRPVAITFDDGYGDTLCAVQALLDHGLTSTVYVTTGQIGRADRLTLEQLRALAQLPGVELGAHGVRHQHLDELTDVELYMEVMGSMRWLERVTNRPVSSFAYPHGAYDPHVRAAVICAGYRSAAAVKNALSHHGDDPFAIARFTVSADTTDQQLAEVLDGKGIPMAWRRERVRTRAHRIARRCRRRLNKTGD